MIVFRDISRPCGFVLVGFSCLRVFHQSDRTFAPKQATGRDDDCSAGRGIVGGAAHRHLLAIRQPLYFDWRATDSNLDLWINRMRYFHGARFFDETQIAWGTPLAEQEPSN